MSQQISLALPHEMVAFLDRAVASGRGHSRASVVRSAIERDTRRGAARQDVRILHRLGAADDLDDVVAWTSNHPPIAD